MRTTDAMPAAIRLALLRDALLMLDPVRNPGQRAETAAVLCEALVAEGLRTGQRLLIAEAATRAAETIAGSPLPAGPRSALVAVLADAVTLLATGRDALPDHRHAPKPRGRATRLGALR
jgi:hypothetical protein